ncbi:MAG: NAD-dependent epimerase/dehydratase family protein, partial [Candidatus Thorarchaeota archaeon]
MNYTNNLTYQNLIQMKSRNILVIGAAGQIGSELVPFLRNRYGNNNVIATGRKTPLPDMIKNSGPVRYLDALERNRLSEVLYEYEIDTIFHMASILSATGEKMPQTAWDININGLINVLEVSRSYNVDKIIWPSSIAAFGPTTPRE